MSLFAELKRRNVVKVGAAYLLVVAYWRAKGYPPQCHPVGTDDFNCD